MTARTTACVVTLSLASRHLPSARLVAGWSSLHSTDRMRMPVTHACEDTRLASRSWLSPALLPTVNRLLRFLAVLFNHPQRAEVCGGVSHLQRSEQELYAVHRNLRFAERVHFAGDAVLLACFGERHLTGALGCFCNLQVSTPFSSTRKMR